MILTRPCGVTPSLSVVNPFMSQNMTVITRRWPSVGGDRGLVEQAFGDLGIDVAAEGFADALVLAQPLDHAVEGGRELADLVPRRTP